MPGVFSGWWTVLGFHQTQGQKDSTNQKTFLPQIYEAMFFFVFFFQTTNGIYFVLPLFHRAKHCRVSIFFLWVVALSIPFILTLMMLSYMNCRHWLELPFHTCTVAHNRRLFMSNISLPTGNSLFGLGEGWHPGREYRRQVTKYVTKIIVFSLQHTGSSFHHN